MRKIDQNLMDSARVGNLNKVKRLLNQGADVHADEDYTLRLASENGHIEVVKVLLENGADVHARDDYALRWASRGGHIEVVKVLLENGADVHASNDYALRWASRYGHVEVVKVLLENGANVHADDDFALRFAKQNNHQEVYDLLKLCYDNRVNMEKNITSKQVGGSHYQDLKIQPVDFIHQNNLNFCQGNIIKYICRYKNKNGLEDLEKVKHYVDLLIKLEGYIK